jgi:CheY-like chemotaxis protein
MKRTEVALAKLASETVRMTSALSPSTTTVVEDHAKPLPVIEGDAAQLRQVVMNLIVNAVEAIQARGGAGTIRVRTFQSNEPPPELAPGPYVVLAVEDDGVGMDEATSARIFDPFFSTKAHGRGLGMSALIGIVRAHEGAVRLSSELGKGTTFEVFFPSSGRLVPSLSTPSSAHAPTPSERRVLVVDDEAAIRDVASLLLEDMGWRVRLAATGEDALARIAAERPDVVLLDLTMPNMSGAEVLARIRRDHGSLPVVIMSGYSEDLLVGRGLDGVSFLQKPFRGNELHSRLEAAASGN